MKEFHVGVAFDRKEMKLHVEVAKRQIEPTEQELFAKQPNPVFIEKKDENLQSMVIEMKYNEKS